MMYTVKDIFYTIQGEGANIGRPAVFIRFAGCNLWSGREKDRATAVCQFCDTDFVGGARYGATALAMEAHQLWSGADHRFVVLTGGEPLLQVDATLIRALRRNGFQIAVETNGTLPVPTGIDWVCVSPKAAASVVIERANELKLVWPQKKAMPERFAALFPAAHHWLSPMDGPNLKANIETAAAYCLAHPEWRLAIQAHKFWNIP